MTNPAILYAYGLSISKIDDKNLNMSDGAARDSTNTSNILLTKSVTINTTLNGLNGLDEGQIIPNSFYAVYVVGDSMGINQDSALLSLNTTIPTLPNGYDIYRRVGWILTDSLSNILNFFQYGQHEERMYYYDSAIEVLANGSATNFTTIDLSSSVPPIATEVLFHVSYTQISPTNFAKFATPGSEAASNFIARFGYGIAAQQNGMLTVCSNKDVNLNFYSILYQVSVGDSLTLLTGGYKDYL